MWIFGATVEANPRDFLISHIVQIAMFSPLPKEQDRRISMMSKIHVHRARIFGAQARDALLHCCIASHPEMKLTKAALKFKGSTCMKNMGCERP